MKVQQINGQLNDSSRDLLARDSGQGGTPRVSPAVFDTSDADDARNNSSADADTVPNATLTPPANQAAGSTYVQQSNGVESVWKRDERDKPVLTEAYGANQADGSRANIKTTFRLDDDGKPQLVGAQVVPRRLHDNSEDDTQLTVFRRGFEDGFTHPGQTIGKITDMQTGNRSGDGEKAGEKADGVLERLPVVGNALTMTRGIVGQKTSDGSPELPSPDAQPDALGATRAAGRVRELPESLPSKAASTKQTGAHAGAAKEVPKGRNNPAVAPAPSPSAKPRVDASYMDKAGSADAQGGGAPQAREAGANASPTTSAPWTVPDGYAHNPSGQVRMDPDTRGLFRDDKDQAFIKAGDQTYAVRYDKDNGTWRAYRPDDPAKPQYPVKPDEHGNWQVHNDVGLKGGGGESQRPAMGWAQQGDIPLHLQARQMELQNQRQQLLQQRQDVEHQINQFPGPGNANRSGLELAHLHHMLTSRRDNLTNQLNQLEQQLQQVHQQMQQQ